MPENLGLKVSMLVQVGIGLDRSLFEAFFDLRLRDVAFRMIAIKATRHLHFTRARQIARKRIELGTRQSAGLRPPEQSDVSHEFIAKL